MLAYARLTPGAGFKPGRAFGYYAQRTITHPPLRRAVSAAIAGAVRAGSGEPEWPRTAEVDEVVRDLRRDGVAPLDPLLAPADAVAMRSYFEDRPVLTESGARTGLADLPKGTSVAGYPLDTVLACPGLLDVLNAPVALAVSAAYLGCKPTISSVGVRWTFPTAAGGARFQDFHRDVDDWRFLKLFIYLTDVDDGSGPHLYVRGSHRTGFGVTSQRYTREALEDRYGVAAIETVTGPAGTTFMADTLGVHRGGRPTTRPRLMLQVQYSLLPVFAFLYDPQDNEKAALIDPFCNRLLVRSPSG